MTKKNYNYFYSELEDQIIVNSISQDFKERQSTRKQYELIWELCMSFYLGNQYSYISNNNEICDIEKNYFWENRNVYNHIAPLIESRLAKLNKVKPLLTIRPTSSSDQDIYSAKLSKSILSNSFELNNFDKIISTATHWSEITGTAFYKVTWENDLGDIIGKIDDREIYNGDVKISVCSPFEIFPDSNSCLEINDCNSIIEARAVPVKYVNSIWNTDLSGEPIELYELNHNSFISSLSGRNNIAKITHSQKYDHTYLIERYEKPNTEHPKGRLTIICQNKLLYDGDLPYKIDKNGNRGYPFIKQTSIKNITSFWGTSVIERCIPIQKSYNSIKNKKHEYIARLASGVLAVEDGSVDIDNLESEGLAPGKILVYRNGSTPPTFMDAGSVPTDLEKEEERLLNELNNLACISELSTSSNVPNNINSGSALSLLIEQDESRLSLVAEHIRFAIKEVGTKVIRLYKQYATEVRLNKIRDNSGGLEIFYWNKNDLTSDDICFEVTNELTESNNSKKETLLTLFDKGILSDKNGKISSSNKLKILDIFGLNAWDIYEDISEHHKNRATNENLQIVKLTEPLEIDDHSIHIEEHTKFIICDTDNSITDEFKNQLLQHIKQHKKFINN